MVAKNLVQTNLSHEYWTCDVTCKRPVLCPFIELCLVFLPNIIAIIIIIIIIVIIVIIIINDDNCYYFLYYFILTGPL